MKIYILLCDRKRDFGNLTFIESNSFIGTFDTLDKAKSAIARAVPDGFREVHSSRALFEHIADSDVIYDEAYADRYESDNINTYKIISYEYVPAEIIENKDLKFRVHKLEKELNELKTNGSEKKPVYTESTIKPKKEEKSNVRLW